MIYVYFFIHINRYLFYLGASNSVKQMSCGVIYFMLSVPFEVDTIVGVSGHTTHKGRENVLFYSETKAS